MDGHHRTSGRSNPSTQGVSDTRTPVYSRLSEATGQP